MMTLPPGLILIVGAAVLAVLKGRVRAVVALALPLLTLAAVWGIIDSKIYVATTFMGFTVAPVAPHAFTPAFATIFCIMMFGGVLFALNQNRAVELPAAFVYGGAAICVTFAGDWISMFVFWELMTIGSTVVVWSSPFPAARAAGLRYFGLHAMGGVLLLAGIVLHAMGGMNAGDPNALMFGNIPAMAGWGWMTVDWSTAGPWLILIGFLINAGAPPFSTWLPDAYPEASESGSVFLSAFTTKTAVFTLLVAFPGCTLLVFVGMVMAIYGIIFAILENDMRRILAYSIVNQVGFMVCGIGIGTELALNGVTAHAFAHIIYKALLLMSAGAVLYRTGKRKCTQLGGLFRTMPVTMWCGIIGALAISSFPLTSGFTTKTMIVDASYKLANHVAATGEAYQYLVVAWFVLEAASAGVFLHAGIKFPWFVFFQKDSGLRPPDAPWNMKAAMIFFSFICIFIGIYPTPLYAMLPFPGVAAKYHVYDVEHVLVMLQLLLYAGLAFFLLLPMLKRTETITLDADWLWRRAIPALWRGAILPGLRGLAHVEHYFRTLPRHIDARVSKSPAMVTLKQSWRTGGAVLVIAVMLIVYLLLALTR